jgi:hypothetical protein
MSRKSPLLAQLVGAPESPREKITLTDRVPAKTEFQGQEAWHAALDQYAQETKLHTYSIFQLATWY